MIEPIENDRVGQMLEPLSFEQFHPDEVPTISFVDDEQAFSSLELEAAVKKFNEAFAERTFSQRHEDLGKMIDCHLCGARHREGDPLVKNSRAHARQNEAIQEVPSLGSAPRSNFAKPRFNPHHKAKQIQFAQLSVKIYEEDIKPYFSPDPERPDNLIRRAQRIAAKFLRHLWIKPRIACKHMQEHSRRINAGLEVLGSRYSHPVRDHKHV